jgi:DNA polymerase I-like protein with 3'-5' exonuclease and polymerase domains
MKKALVLLNNDIRKNKWENVKYVANVHDEIQIECPEGIAEDVGKAARQAIIQAGVEFNLRCPLDGEYKIGRNWRETH